MEAAKLTPTEARIVQLVTAGRSTEQIASELAVRKQTVRNALSSAMHKSGVRNRVELVRLSIGAALPVDLTTVARLPSA